jgi:hypothetical protein
MVLDMRSLATPLVVLLTAAAPLAAQTQTPPQTPPRQGPPVQGAEIDVPLVARFDRNGDERLDYVERLAAREYLGAHPELRPPPRGQRITRTGAPGVRLTQQDVQPYDASVPLYEPTALRTIFLQFEHDDWEQELAAFWHTDVEIPATLSMDGKTYRDVGVSFPRQQFLHRSTRRVEAAVLHRAGFRA